MFLKFTEKAEYCQSKSLAFNRPRKRCSTRVDMALDRKLIKIFERFKRQVEMSFFIKASVDLFVRPVEADSIYRYDKLQQNHYISAT